MFDMNLNTPLKRLPFVLYGSQFIYLFTYIFIYHDWFVIAFKSAKKQKNKISFLFDEQFFWQAHIHIQTYLKNSCSILWNFKYIVERKTGHNQIQQLKNLKQIW